ncbi:MAG: hypothetical protein M1136_10000 [Chloroflexi bacterium]|nr:hypothetical protein [Chloroflexota bacterium]MCL5075962.1 hypothetical protein [Chloroflexota bacterium]
MLKRVATFNVPYYALDLQQADYVISYLKGVPGVKSAVLYEISEGDPHYCLEVEIEQDDPALASRLQGLITQYTPFISDLTLKVYKPLAGAKE